MITTQFLYESDERLCEKLSGFDSNKQLLIQIFTNSLFPEQSVKLASTVQTLCPNAKVIGTSVNGVIYNGEQYDNHTLIVAEQYDKTLVSTHLVSLEEKTYEKACLEMDKLIGNSSPCLLRLFIGNYYDYAHQLAERMNFLRPNLKIVGGISGEIHPDTTQTPFVFDSERALTQGFVFCTLENPEMMVYGRINTAHEAIGDVYTITKTKDRAIIEIENEPAKQWLERNFGVLSTKEFKTWEEIAQNDPLVRLQLSLENHNRSIRFVHYDEANDEITQYFSRLPNGTKFKISYTSPSKCAEESMETCLEVAKTPIEQLFCYSCLFRKLYLKNCAKWELSPYHKNPVNGVFLLGEFGYNEQGNALLNGSSVLSGVAEYENYLSVDVNSLNANEYIKTEDEKLMDFIIRKTSDHCSSEHQKILEAMIEHESNHITNPYQRISSGIPVGDLKKYEVDKVNLHFNKLCMIRVENADVIIGQSGQIGYFSHLKFIMEQLQLTQEIEFIANGLHFYFIKTDTFLVACNRTVDRFKFSKYVHALQERCCEIQKKQTELPFLIRFIMVRNHQLLLERSYAIMENCRHSQHHIIKDDHFEDGELSQINLDSVDELSCIQLIQYALENDKVIPYYQGLYNNQTGKIDKYEALMRLSDYEGRVYTPYHFMEIAKKYRLYLDLNLKMFETVLRDFSKLDCSVSINLSVHDILSPRFFQRMREALNNFHKPSNLTFELLEDECISNIDGIQEFITEIRSYGVKIAIDDFGSGYSNLLEIAKIRPDYIKIDGQIINNIEKYEENESILEAVALLGKRLSIDLVAEFVETAAIQEKIMAHSIFYSQGYHFSKPKPFSEVFLEIAPQYKLHTTKKEALVSVNSSTQIQNEEIDTHDFFRAIQALTSDLLFIYDLNTKKLRHFGLTEHETNFPPIIENFPQSILDKGLIATEDVPVLLDALNQIRQGVEKPSYFRIFTSGNVPNWYKMDYKLVLDQRNVPTEVIGKLTNIQQQKELEARINIDAMTGCLRKDAFESLVEDYMQKNPNSTGVLYIIDLDNFKSVNDNLGHQFGDRVLRNVGDKLHSLFSGEDLVGRIGGDEFMVMMIGSDNLEIAKQKAIEIISALDTTYSGCSKTYRVSASVGIATFPNHGCNFKSLYDNTDIALFDAKNRGKNGYVIYNNKLSKGTMENTLPYEIAARTLAQHYDTHVVEETFNLLFETKDFDVSINTVLELIGKRFGVSRCYIFEKHPYLADTYTNTYEWCADNISPEYDKLSAVPLEIFEDFFEQANQDGILYCNDLSMLKKEEGRQLMESQEIKSFLHTYINSDDTISYIIGIDECNSPRIWTPIEISTISQAGKIIAQFLSYKRAVLDLETIAHERLSILNSLNYYAYIIDINTYELTYFNKFTKKHSPDISLGQFCYNVLRKRNTPCKDCPITLMKKQNLTDMSSIITETTLGKHLLAMSSLQANFAGRECGCITAIPLDDIENIKFIDSSLFL